jgi:hypothetical protein
MKTSEFAEKILGLEIADYQKEFIDSFETFYFGQPYERDEVLYEAACEYEARTELFDRGLYLTWKQNQFLEDGSIVLHPLNRQDSYQFARNLIHDLAWKYSEKYSRYIKPKEILKEASRYNYTADEWIKEWERLNDRI